MKPSYRVITDDAFHALDRLEAKSIDTVFTSPDPPFHNDDDLGVGATKSFKEYYTTMVGIFDKLPRVLKDTGSLWIEMGDFHNPQGSLVMVPYILALMMSNEWLLRSDVIWHRPDDSQQEDMNRFKRDCEHCFLFAKSTKHYFNRKYSGTSMFSFPYIEPEQNGRYVVSGFPEEMIEVCLQSTCPPGGTVLDPFCGSGITGKVALQNGMSFIGIELEKRKITNILKVLKSV